MAEHHLYNVAPQNGVGYGKNLTEVEMTEYVRKCLEASKVNGGYGFAQISWQPLESSLESEGNAITSALDESKRHDEEYKRLYVLRDRLNADA